MAARAGRPGGRASRRVRGPAAHRAAGGEPPPASRGMQNSQRVHDAKPRTAPMARRRDGDIAPYRHAARGRRHGKDARGGVRGRKRQKNRFRRIPAIDSTEPEFPQGKQAVVRNWRRPLHRHRFGRHRCGFRRPCSSGRLYGWYRCRCRHRRCTGRWSGFQRASSRVVP